MRYELKTLRIVTLRVLAGLMLQTSSILAADGDQAQPPRPPGRLVDIGGYRLHLWCMGKEGEGPAVVLIPGAGDFSFTWGLVQPAVAKFTRACSYDAAGQAWSDKGPEPRTFKQEAYELRTVLRTAGVNGPYVLVGASLGGIIARVFARDYPNDVAGMVLVGSTDPDMIGVMALGKTVRIRSLAQKRAIPPVQTMERSPPKPPTIAEVERLENYLKFMGEPKVSEPHNLLPPELQKLDTWARFYQPRAALAAAKRQLAAMETNQTKAPASGTTNTDYGLGWWPEEFQALYEHEQVEFPLDNIPLITLISSDKAKPVGQQKGKTGSEEEQRISEEKAEQHIAQALLSSNGRYVKIESGHEIHLYQPAWVIEAIRQVVEAARKRTTRHP